MLTNPSNLSRWMRRPASAAVAVAVGLSALTVMAQAPAPSAGATATATAASSPVQLQDNAPDRHVVVKGDTLWGISSKFLKSPWRWPDVWGMNKEQIRNPHRIYPGQVIVLDRNAPGGPRLSVLQPGEGGVTQPGGIVRLSPQIRAEAREAEAIPTILPGDIEPFMARNNVIGAETLDGAPQIVRSVGERVVFSTSDAIYVVGIKPEMGKVFQVYRKGRELRDPSISPRPWYKWRHNEVDPQIIGYEAEYLGDAKLLREGEVARLEVFSARQEMRIGDYLIPAPPAEPSVAWVPHAPDVKVEGVVMTLPNGISEAGKTNIVTINLGKRHGVEVGHVLAAYKPKESFDNPRYKESPLNWVPGWPKQKGDEPVKLDIPEERIGLVFVYRVFDNISYAMVMNTGIDNVRTGYLLRNP